MKRLSCIVALTALLTSTGTFAQSAKTSKTSVDANTRAIASTTNQVGYPNLKIQAQETGDAFVRKDFNRVVDYTFPRIIELTGGRSKTISFLKRGARNLEKDGMTLVSFDVGEPTEVILVGERLYSIVPTTLTMKAPEGQFVGESFLVGISKDGGNKWTFVDGEGVADKRRLRLVLPDVADRLQFPGIKQPVFQPNK